jgi:hypothetical protein
MSRTLSGRSSDVLNKFLNADAQDYDPDIGTNPDPYSKILGWAEDPEHGGLPSYAAGHFANWLSNCWSNWTEEPCTVKDVLEGAVTDWCGGRVMSK